MNPDASRGSIGVHWLLVLTEGLSVGFHTHEADIGFCIGVVFLINIIFRYVIHVVCEKIDIKAHTVIVAFKYVYSGGVMDGYS